ncbi:MAG: ExeM/NucH family extracellular endonuclease, partial [Gammaproteobacteria bacterium]|nr:ExeM/NucH family extracellular endonuclease [Gammaproteobacteria bacterium]
MKNKKLKSNALSTRIISAFILSVMSAQLVYAQDCGQSATFIHAIQGSGTSSPEVGNTHSIEGIIVGDFQTSANLRGFFIQEEDSDADGDAMTSEGIFVYDGSSPAVDVAVGDVVRVTGKVEEYYGLTRLKDVSGVSVCQAGGVASAATVTMPVASLGDWEYTEGMLININQTLYATGNYTWGRYGEVDLSVNDRLYNPTNVAAPGAPAGVVGDLNDRSRIQLEDGRAASNPDPVPYLGAGNTLRAGDTLPSLTGVLNYAYGLYEVHPTGPIAFSRANARTSAPTDVGGTLKVASFNVLNYFSTLDDSGPICGPSANMSCRGADNANEFTRQRDKIISAITAMDADVIGLIEIENHATDAALQDLVNGLNDA